MARYEINFDSDALLCRKAGADTASGDDTYLLFNGQRLDVLSRNIPTSEFNTGEFSIFFFAEKSGYSDIFSNSLNIQLWDEDGGLNGPDDFMGSITPQLTGNEAIGVPLSFKGSTSGEGSKYNFSFTITRLNDTIFGKVASDKGGILNGSNTDGTLIGRNGDDLINANNGDDILVGGNGKDILRGGKGRDILFGGKGNDLIRGGKDNDTVVLAKGYGTDTIKDFDFRQSGDQIGLAKGLSYEDLTFTKVGSSTRISADNSELALLQGIRPTQLGAEHFSQFDLGSFNARVKSDMAALKAV